jgi:hypothetical protein
MLEDDGSVSFEDFADFFSKMYADSTEAWQCLNEKDSQYNRRSFVRVVFRDRRHNICALKQICLNDPRFELYSPGEMAMLREESYRSEQQGRHVYAGEVHTNGCQFPVHDKPVYAIRRPSFVLDTTNPGWCGFSKKGFRSDIESLIQSEPLPSLLVTRSWRLFTVPIDGSGHTP